MKKWRVEYVHDRETPGMTSLIVWVEAPDEERAIKNAGMARAESFTNRFLYRFYRTHRIQWKRVSVREVWYL